MIRLTMARSSSSLTRRKSLLIRYFISLALALSICSCDLVDNSIQGSNQPSLPIDDSVPANNTTWDFLDASKYAFDQNYVQVANAKVALKEVDTVSDFSNGVHFGTYVDQNNAVTISAKSTNAESDVTALFPTKNIDLIGYWRMDGNYADSSGNNLPTIPVGVITRSGNSKLGTESGDFSQADAGDYLDITYTGTWSKMTISVWGYVTSTGNVFTDTIVSSNRFRFQRGDGPSAALEATFVAGALLTGTSPIILNAWNHYLLTWDGATAKTYLNGSLESSEPQTGVLNITALRIGQDGLSMIGMIDGWQGLLDEVAIWKTDFSTAEVNLLHAAQSGDYTGLSSLWTPKYSSILGYWKLDGSWRDSSGNGYDAVTNIGSPIFSVPAQVGSQAGLFDNFDAITTSAGPDFSNQSFSIGVWVNRSSLTSTDYVFGQGPVAANSSLHIGFNPADNFIFGFYMNNLLTTDTYEDIDTWSYWAVTFDVTDKARKIYRNAELVASDTAAANYQGTGILCLGGGGSSCFNRLDGAIDDIALWGVALTQDDISIIYNRQKQKFSGHYDSPILAAGSTSPWTYLKATTPLPYNKILPGVSNESSTSYSMIVGATGNTTDNNLMSNIVGLWHFDENSWVGAAGDLIDSSGNGNNGIRVGSIITTRVPGLFNSYGQFLKSSADYIDVSTLNQIDYSLDSFSVSTWVRAHELQVAVDTYFMGNYDGTTGWALNFKNSNNFEGLLTDSTVTVNSVSTTNSVNQWAHIAYVINRTSNRATLYFNGVQKDDQDISSLGSLASANNFQIGQIAGASSCQCDFDETAIWKRALHPSEIEQLYLRSSNRVKYLVKSCIDLNCNCTDFSGALPTSQDCNGNGVSNTLDPDQTGRAQWLGRNGSGTEPFSELHNCNVINSSGNCVGSSKNMPPNFVFADFPASAQPSPKPYFQYRIILEAEENLLCNSSSEPCLPSVTSIEIGPSPKYYGGSPTITPVAPLSYSAIESISFIEAGSCSISYQLSPDDSNYYYWNGTSWLIASNLSESSSAVSISSNIGSFVSEYPAGNFNWKAILKSDTTQSCELKQVSVN